MYRIDLINAAMGARRMTNEELAAKSGLAIRVISEIRNGKRNPTVATLKAVADALGLTMSELFTEQDAQAA